MEKKGGREQWGDEERSMRREVRIRRKNCSHLNFTEVPTQTAETLLTWLLHLGRGRTVLFLKEAISKLCLSFTISHHHLGAGCEGLKLSGTWAQIFLFCLPLSGQLAS